MVIGASLKTNLVLLILSSLLDTISLLSINVSVGHGDIFGSRSMRSGVRAYQKGEQAPLSTHC
jgi:hypothetical protein